MKNTRIVQSLLVHSAHHDYLLIIFTSCGQFKIAVATVLVVENQDLVKVDDSLTKCTVDGWQRRASVYNTATQDESAADIAASQASSALAMTPLTSEDFT